MTVEEAIGEEKATCLFLCLHLDLAFEEGANTTGKGLGTETVAR